MRFSLTNLGALVFLLALSSPAALAAPTIPGIGRHRNPATVSARDAASDVTARAPSTELMHGVEHQLKRADLLPEYERRMEQRMKGVLNAMGEAKARNAEQKKHKRTRMARRHP